MDLTDAILALQVVASMGPAPVYSSADVNADGKIGTEEVIYILQKVSGLRGYAGLREGWPMRVTNP